MLRTAPLGAMGFLALLLIPLPATATVMYGTSTASGILSELSGAVNQSAGPTPTVSGTAPAPYSTGGGAPSVSAGGITTGNVTLTVSSTVDGGTGSRVADAESVVGGLDILFGGVLNLLTLGGDSVTTTAEVSGDDGNYTASGSTTIVGGSLKIGTLTLVGLPDQPAPNTVISDALGVKVVLNEQFMTGNGSNGLEMVVNGIHITFTDALLGLSLLNGDIYIAQSQAALATNAPIPEPGTGALVGLGTLLLAAHRRRSRS